MEEITLFRKCFNPVMHLVSELAILSHIASEQMFCFSEQRKLSRCETVPIREREVATTVMFVLYFAAAETKTPERQLFVTGGHWAINILQ